MKDVDPSGTGTTDPDDHSRPGPPPPPPPPPLDAPPTAPSEEPSEHPGKRKRPFWVELPLLVVIAFVVALIIKTFLLQAFYIPSVSMVSTLHVGDRVLVEKVSYRFHEPRRGDVVVFERDAAPGVDTGDDDGSFMSDVTDAFKGLFGFPTGGNEDFIKRVIAVEGDSIECHDGQVMVNGEVIEEPYLDDGIVTSSFTKTVIPDGMMFVMGDNRMDSQDSRSYGPIAMDKVIGHAFVIVWPFSNLGGL